MYCKDIEREIEVKKVILSLAIAGLCVSSDCYGSQGIMDGHSDATILNNKQKVSEFRVDGQSHVLVDVDEISTLDYLKLRVKVKRQAFQKKLKTAAVVGAWLAVGVGVGAGVVAYYMSPSLDEFFLGIGRTIMHGMYGGLKCGYEALKFTGRSALWLNSALVPASV